MELHYTLVCDGSTDAALLPILDWLLSNAGLPHGFQGVWADLRNFPQGARVNLANKILTSLTFFPCDLLFIHRDAERSSYNLRKNEIDQAIQHVQTEIAVLPIVCVVPVRMTEAWLLIDESAIRRAAGNPNGRISLTLPRVHELEHLPDPKNILIDLITQASGLPKRRIDTLPFSHRISQISEYITDFSPLRSLTAFQILERDIINIVASHSWYDRTL